MKSFENLIVNSVYLSLKRIYLILIILPLFVFTQEQDSLLNNLEHPKWYKPVKLGKYGDVIKIGSGDKHLIIVSGAFDHSVFYEFMMRNSENFTFHAFTSAGLGTTIAPQIPEKLNYDERPWSQAFEKAVINYIDQNDLKEVNLLGFFAGGVQHAIHIAAESKAVKKLILVSGDLYRAGLTEKLSKEDRSRAALGTAQGWFKTVTQKTWYNGMHPPSDYANDSIMAQRIWERANLPSIPTQIQYYSEFVADDPSEKLIGLNRPILVMSPSFNSKFLEDPNNQYIFDTVVGTWVKFEKEFSPKDYTIINFPDSQFFIFYDKTDEFDLALLKFISQK